MSAEDQVETFFIPVDALQDLGISAADINKLKSAGIATVAGVQQATRRNLCKVKGLSDAKVDKIKEAAAKLAPNSFRSGTEIAREREKVLYISTGSKAFDAILGGGIQTQSITEVFGEYRCGKSQLAMTLSVMCQLPVEEGGAAGKACFIDTEGTFRPDRIRAIAGRFGVDGDACLDNISVARAVNSEHQYELLNACCQRFAEDPHYKLLIVDSLIALFRVDYTGRGMLSERQQALNQMMAKLTQIAEAYNIAVLITNQVQSDPGANSLFAGASDKKAVGGHVVAHASATRVSLRKGRDVERICKIVDSPEMPEADATYKISAEGIMDA